MPVDVSAPLPQLDLPAFAIVTVTLDDPAAVVTQLVVHGFQTLPGEPAPIIHAQPLFIPIADEPAP